MDLSTPLSATTLRDRADSYTSTQELASFFRPPEGGGGRHQGACRPETLTPDFLAGSEPMALPVFRRTCYSSDGLEAMTSGSGMLLQQAGTMAVDMGGAKR